eukprot:5652931-Pyramimonas_sp.AAC.1
MVRSILKSMWCPRVPQKSANELRSIVRSTGVLWCPVVSRGVPLSVIDSEIDTEIDVVPRSVRGVPWCPNVSR